MIYKLPLKLDNKIIIEELPTKAFNLLMWKMDMIQMTLDLRILLVFQKRSMIF